MTRVTVTWEGDSYQRAVRAAAADGLAAAATTLQKLVKFALNESGTPTSPSGRKDLAKGRAILRREKRIAEARAKAGASILARGIGFNLPGRPLRANKRNARLARTAAYFQKRGLVDPPGGIPRRRSGDLRRSINVKNDRNALRSLVGSGKVYARIHERGGFILNGFGIGRRIYIPPRPYLKRTLDENIPEIVKVFNEVYDRSLLARARKRGIQ
jgi:phage gpG-like protein